MNREKMILATPKPALEMAFVMLVLLFAVNRSAGAAESPPQSSAWPGCPDTCGNLTDIPYPFGIGPGCFLDPRYEIDCQRTHAPVLKNLSVAVLDISLPNSSNSPGLIKVSQPISYSQLNCTTNQQNAAPVDLRASNSVFRYSQSQNYFVAGGCDSLALMAGINTPWAVVGCKSSCGINGTLGFNQCSRGIGCCMTSIPDEISEYSVEFKTLSGEAIAPEDAGCRYAFLVDRTWWYEADLHHLPSDVPVVLEWAITDYEDELLSNQKNRRGNDSSASCRTYSTPGVPSLTYCSCNEGYRGNYFLPQGCQDINECEEDPNLNCRGKCVNRPGSYDCVDNKIMAMIGMGTGVGDILLFFLFWWLYKFIKRRREAKLRQDFFKRNGGLLLQQRLSSIEDNHLEKGKLFTSMELDAATDHFNENRILGRGGQGTVYKGMLIDGTIIAVKNKSKVVDAGRVEQFVNEVVILSEINHRNVVKLLGFCPESEAPLLVYEYVSNGTLYQHLHDPNREFPVAWEMRLRIANEVAGALSYLHFASAIPVYHRDIKSSNILLDERYGAKVADFGASKSITIDQTHLTTMVRGTFGYLDPEYYQTSRFSNKSDVYSFGVVLVELLTGEKPISQGMAEDGRNLAMYFVISMEENRLFNILDKEVLDHGEKEVIIAVSNLAKICLNPHGRYRPSMKEVAMELERVRSLQNSMVVRQKEEEIDRRNGSNRASGAVSTLILSKADVELTSWEEDQSFSYDLPR
ncbi:wall-associated receptor kinase-like 1 [Rhodamnia argentea]|uniref:Wall-associated receptor kinase-like 1 n=1 Tax=Rhodamnia argentea TaxID=178133 RepID=A0ABM3GTV6_9MYRT|nr:wall-associated receptor kinase-like 1 [Rhodamnia argentea]